MAETFLCLMTAYDTETEASITMTYVPAHLYYMLFELMKVSIGSSDHVLLHHMPAVTMHTSR